MTSGREDFEGGELPIDFQWLRSPYPDELFSLKARPGHLRLHGRETIGSAFRQALVARRHAEYMLHSMAHYQPIVRLSCW